MRGLAVFNQMAIAGRDIDDDGLVGDQLARESVYTFRNQGGSIRSLLATEHSKSQSNQGTRTAARELRRMFTLLGFLTIRSGRTELSNLGRNLINLFEKGQGNQVKASWKAALEQMQLGDSAENTSHPYQVMLNMIGRKPGMPKKYLALAFDAENDSEAELNRILGTTETENWQHVLDAMHTTATSAANAVKILPALALQVGDILETNDLMFLQSVPQEIIETRISDLRLSERPSTDRKMEGRQVKASQIAPVAHVNPELEMSAEDALRSIQDAIEATRERSKRHQSIVKLFANMCEGAGFILFENPYDCLAVKGNFSILAEGKTLSGTQVDERGQVQRALSQLYYYENFYLPEDNSGHQTVILIGLFESEISDSHKAYLDKCGIDVVWISGNTISGSAATLQKLRDAGLVI